MNLRTRIKNKLKENGINQETQYYVMKYLRLNQQLFGEFLDINQIADRIAENLKYNIDSKFQGKNILNKAMFLLMLNGGWNSAKKKITINPIRRFSRHLGGFFRKRYESIVMHELDHCATTTYKEMTAEELEKKIDQLCKKEHASKKDRIEAKKGIRGIDKKQKMIWISSGISNTAIIDTNGLNEGITAYKQEMYDKKEKRISMSAYRSEKKVAKHIAEVIGVEKLIRLHANNDYEGIREAFTEKTGCELNDLVKSLNKISIATRNIKNIIPSSIMQVLGINDLIMNRTLSQFKAKEQMSKKGVQNKTIRPLEKTDSKIRDERGFKSSLKVPVNYNTLIRNIGEQGDYNKENNQKDYGPERY